MMMAINKSLNMKIQLHNEARKRNETFSCNSCKPLLATVYTQMLIVFKYKQELQCNHGVQQKATYVWTSVTNHHAQPQPPMIVLRFRAPQHPPKQAPKQRTHPTA